MKQLSGSPMWAITDFLGRKVYINPAQIVLVAIERDMATIHTTGVFIRCTTGDVLPYLESSNGPVPYRLTADAKAVIDRKKKAPALDKFFADLATMDAEREAGQDGSRVWNTTDLDHFREMIRRENFVVLDTETTGIRGEICQIAIINSSGDVLLDTLVKPSDSIPSDATRIHGISNADVADAPTWADITDRVEELLTGQHVVVYNAKFDRGRMHQSAENAGLPKVDWKTFSTWWCAMELFAEEYGDWNDYHGSYRWQKLSTAATHYGIPVVDAHTALADCQMTLQVVKAMAAVQTP